MAITDKKEGVWGLDQTYAKDMQGVWDYDPLRELWIAGRNTYGQLGQNQNEGNQSGYSSPVQVPGTKWNGGTITTNYSILLTRSDGTLWSMGYNGYGQLGLGNNTAYSSPVQIPGTNWAQVSGMNGHDSVLANKTDGTLWAWGMNEYGQLGQNNRTNYNEPQQIGTATDWAYGSYSIHCSGYNSMMIKQNGELWMVGSNQYGWLGQGAENPGRFSSPVQVPGTDWAKCGRGYNHSSAIKSNGDGYSWGYNTYGQLGQGNKTQRFTPTQIPGSWLVLAGSNDSGAGVKTDGTLLSWGRNQNGLLGQNNTWAPSGDSPATPTEVTGGGTTWNSLSAGWSCYRMGKSDGTIWGMGDSGEGSFGTNERTQYSSPVQTPGTSWAGFENVGAVGDGDIMLKEQ